MIGHCPENRSADLLQKTIGADNGCSSYFAESIIRRFWAKVRVGRESVCWEWTASTVQHGFPYGQFALPRALGVQKHIYAHRMAWTLTHGPIPDGLVICHRCDNPKCCNPTHLFLGTQGDNVRDGFSKNRYPKARRGRKLSIAERLEIGARLRGGELAAHLAREFGVSEPLLSRMRRDGVFQTLTTHAQEADRRLHITHQPVQLVHVPQSVICPTTAEGHGR